MPAEQNISSKAMPDCSTAVNLFSDAPEWATSVHFHIYDGELWLRFDDEDPDPNEYEGHKYVASDSAHQLLLAAGNLALVKGIQVGATLTGWITYV